MQVILLERVKNLGFMGDVVNVKPGYGRNYLIRFHKALRATEENLEIFKSRKAHLEAENLKLKKDAEAVAKKMEGLALILIRNAGESGQLYGSVSAKDITIEMKNQNITINSKQVHLNAPIKVVGLHKAFIQLHPEVEIEVRINVAMSQEEADAQAKGIDVIAEKKKAQQQEASDTASQMGAAAVEEEGEDETPSTSKPKAKSKGKKPSKSKEE